MRTAQTGLFAIAAIVAIIIGFLFTLIEVHLLLYKNGFYQCGAKCYHQCRDIGKIKYCLGYCLKVINAIFLLWAVLVSRRTKTFFSQLSDQNCSSAQYSADLTNFSDQVDTLVFAKNRNALISFGIAVLVDILKIILKCTSKKKKEEIGVVESVGGMGPQGTNPNGMAKI